MLVFTIVISTFLYQPPVDTHHKSYNRQSFMQNYTLLRPKDFQRLLGRLAIKLNEKEQSLSLLNDVINNSKYLWRLGAYQVWDEFMDRVEKELE